MNDNPPHRQKRDWSTVFWNVIMRYGIMLVIIVFFVTVNIHFSYTPDDTYIYLQYARNIANGDGFSFNAGSPSYGITGPLWVLLIAGGTTFGLDPYIVAKTLDVLFASMAILVGYVLAFAVVRDRIYALVAAWMVSFDAWILRWAASGMETSLALLLALLVAWYAYRKEYVVASFVSGVLTLVRPEGVLIFIAVVVDTLLNVRDRRTAVRALLGSGVTYGVIIGAWLAFAYAQFGSFAPNTLQAKTTAEYSLPVTLFTTLSTLKILLGTQAVPIGFLVVGVAISVRKRGWGTLREDGFLILWIVLLPTLYVALNVQVVSRYLTLIIPFVVIFGIWGIKRLELSMILSPRGAFAVLFVVAGISLVQNQIVYRSMVVPHMQNFTLGMNECLRPIAYWLRSNAPRDATVLTPDIGLLGYVSERTVIETAGLVTPEMKRAFHGTTYDDGMTQRRYEQVLRPDYIVDRSPTPERLASDSLRPVMTRPFSGLGVTKTDLVYYTLYRVTR